MRWLFPKAVGASLLALCTLGPLGCVGPATPLGAVDHPLRGYAPAPEPAPARLSSRAKSPDDPVASIFFSPAYQQVHAPYTWKILVVDPSSHDPLDLSRIRVYYNGLEVTESARFQFDVDQEAAQPAGQEAILLEMPNLRLQTMKDHKIWIEYRAPSGAVVCASYLFPAVEDLAGQEPIESTEPFSVDSSILEAIREAGERYRINPALLAALIAQESSFDPRALSKAHALGLTQITHLTEKDIAQHFPDWPRYPRIGRFSRRRLRRLIPRVINRSNEWRLDPVKSVWGGAYYLGYLRDRLEDDANRATVREAGADEGEALAEACLASYNSGLNRVLYMIKKHGDEWLEQRPTREAKRYVRRVLSYYGAFTSDGSLPPLLRTGPS